MQRAGLSKPGDAEHIVNVKTGTRTIRDGQTITVDGTRGVVEL